MDDSKNITWYSVLWYILRPVMVILLAGLICAGGIYMAVGYVTDNFLSPVDVADDTPIPFTVKSSSTLSGVSANLKEAGLIRNKGVFQYSAEFQGAASKLKAGEYELSRDMTNQEILNILMAGDGKVKVLTIKLIEGMTVEEMASSLVKQGALTDTRAFLELCRTGESYRADYDFIDDAAELNEAHGTRRYVLEGYLFPDTYEIYKGSEPDAIIRRMLNRTREIFNTQFLGISEEEGMTMDEALTLASIIEKEAKPVDFAKVSAVFHNRMKKSVALESCVTVQYALKIKRLALTSDDLKVNSPYNTYRNKGLPLGPVSNPSRAAIDAALNPDAAYVEDGYMYFCSKDPIKGELQFSITYDEHNAAAEEYRDLWRAFDEKNGY